VNRNAMELARENEILRNELRELQAGREVDAQEALAMVAKSLLEQEQALQRAVHITTALVMKLAAKGALIIPGAPARDLEVQLDGEELAAVDRHGLGIDQLPGGGLKLIVRPPRSEIARPE
jgi:hypothetical protein